MHIIVYIPVLIVLYSLFESLTYRHLPFIYSFIHSETYANISNCHKLLYIFFYLRLIHLQIHVSYIWTNTMYILTICLLCIFSAILCVLLGCKQIDLPYMLIVNIEYLYILRILCICIPYNHNNRFTHVSLLIT